MEEPRALSRHRRDDDATHPHRACSGARAKEARRGAGARDARRHPGAFVHPTIDLEAVDQALTRLEAFDPQQARIVELRFFAGLSVEETAEVLSISKATVKRDWAMARAWLRRELEGGGPQ